MMWIAVTFIILFTLAILIEPARQSLADWLAEFIDGVLFLLDCFDFAITAFWNFLWPEVWPTEPASCHVGCQCEVCLMPFVFLEDETNDVY